MKKLLSICFLSIFLMMFSAQAQVECCFQLSNPAGDTLHNIDNMPNGDLPLSHSMNVPGLGRTDVYDLIFSDANCGIDLDTGKVSLELELWCDGENILDGQHNVSKYCEITLQTKYNELKWVGTPMKQENYPVVFEYPGAVKIFSGTYNISNVAFDYFFFNFLVNTQTQMLITWKQVRRDVQLIVHVRERIGGTNNEFYWNDQQNLNVGGHQSRRGGILASDTLSTDKYIEIDSTVKSCNPVTVGYPAYTMDHTDTFNIAYVDTSCGYRIDSIVTYAFELVEHPTKPTLSDSNYTFCQDATADPITLDADPNPALAQHDIVAEWSVTDADDNSFVEAASLTPPTNFNIDTTLTYYVRRHDNETGCYSDVDTFEVKIRKLPVDPVVTDTLVEYCLNDTAVALTYTVPSANLRVLWGTSADDITDTAAPKPLTTTAGTTIYYLKLQDTTTCVSAGYDSIKVRVYSNPTVDITVDNPTLCYGDTAKMKATPTNLTTYQWQQNGTDVTGATDTIFSYINNVTDTTNFKFMVNATQKHVVKSCKATDTVDVLAYPAIGAPTPVRGDTTICGKQTVTLEVANGSHASTSKWYNKTKDVELGTGTTLTREFTVTDTVYVSSLNDFGCETDTASWLRIVVRVDSVPQITLTADNNAEVCAEEELIIRSSVTPASTNYLYQWSGTGLQSPLNEDSVVFKHATRGSYLDTLYVRNTVTNCFNQDTIRVTVDSLPEITKEVNYTIRNNEFCVDSNGRITFLQPDYVRYSIDSAKTWRDTKVFDTLGARTYYLVVEDGHGCKNQPKAETIINAPVMPVLTVTDTANTRCEAEYNGKLVAHVTPAATYNYQLNDGGFQADSVFTGLQHGNTYRVIVKDITTGCRDTVENAVVNDSTVTPKLTLVQNPNTHCHTPYGGSIAVTAMDPANAVYKYRMYDGTDYTAYQFDTLFSGLDGKKYIVYAQDTLTACVGSDTITVKDTTTRPTAVFVGPDYKCFSDTMTVFSLRIDSANVVFKEWGYSGSSEALVTPFKYNQSFKMIGFPAGTHIFKGNIEDTLTKCTNVIVDSVRVTSVNIVLHITPPTAVCAYDTVTAFCEYTPVFDGVDHIVNYDWQNENPIIYKPGVMDTVKVTPSVTGNYIGVVATDNHGCTGTFGRFASVNPLPEITIGVGSLDYCQNVMSNVYPSVTGSTATPFAFSWTKGGSVVSTMPSLNINVGTTDFDVLYHVHDVNGCHLDSTISVNVIEIPGEPIFTPDTQYFCSAEDILIQASTISQDAPQTAGSVFTWKVNDPNTAKVAGTYSAYYVNTENGHPCYSDTTDLEVIVKEKPKFDVAMKYNGTTVIDTLERCYIAGAYTEELNFSITEGAALASATSKTYTYTRNGHVDNTLPYNVHQTEPGIYRDTIKIQVMADYGTGITASHCDWDTTLYFTLKINALPTAPENFPHAYNGTNDSIIFYCEGSTANYTFTAQANTTYTYSPGGTNRPDTVGSYKLIVTNTITNCVDSFPYKIVKVPAPKVLVNHTAGVKNCSEDLINDTIVAKITNSIDASYTRFFVWNSPVTTITPDSVAKMQDTDTLYYQFKDGDTLVAVKTGIYAANGDYTATCYKTPAYDTVKVLFQALPTMPKLVDTFSYYVDSATASYCASDYGTFKLDSSYFVTSASAVVHIVGKTIVDTAGIYQVVANNIAAPGCPSDTLTFYVREKRTPKEPLNIGTGKYDYKVYFCENTTPDYTFERENGKDTFLFAKAGETNFVTSKPDTAGNYTLRVLDIVDSCYKDVNFQIIKVSVPDWTVSLSWNDTNICQTDSIYVMSYTPTITAASGYTMTPGATQVNKYLWDGVEGTISHSYNFGVGKDTILTFAYEEYDTIGNTGYGVACAFDGWKDTIKLDYFATPAAPVYNGLTQFCYGDSIVVGVDSFTVTYIGTDTTELYTAATLPATYKTVGTSYFDVQSQYKAFKACKSDPATTITINGYGLPVFTATPDKAKICFEGDTATLTASDPSLTYKWSNDSTTASIKVTDTLMYIVTGTDANNCSSKDSVQVAYYPGFTVELSNDTVVCVGEDVDLSATVNGTTDPFTLTWYKDSVSTASLKFTDPSIASGYKVTHNFTPDSSAIVNGVPVPNKYMIQVEDANHCMMSATKNVIKVSATNRPQFEFYAIGGSEKIDHLEVSSGTSKGFEMYVKKNCWKEGERVFIDVQVYKDGVALSDAELGSAMNNIEASIYNTSYNFDVTNANAPIIYSATGKYICNSDKASFFFPNSDFISTYASYSFDWIYMHFLDARKITVNTGSWKPSSAGVYTFSFAVIKASDLSMDHMVNYIAGKKVGGNGGHNGLTSKDTIAFDTFSFYVDTVYVGTSDMNIDGMSYDNTVVTTAPEEEAVEAKVINMNVYPNPANNNVNIVLEGVQGQTMITIHDMSGKAVSSMRVDVDNNGQIFNLPVDNYSQGIYFIKAVNGSAVMTKKLIIAR